MKRIILFLIISLIFSFFVFGAPSDPTAHNYLKTADDDYIVTDDGDYIYAKDGKIAIKYLLLD